METNLTSTIITREIDSSVSHGFDRLAGPRIGGTGGSAVLEPSSTSVLEQDDELEHRKPNTGAGAGRRPPGPPDRTIRPHDDPDYGDFAVHIPAVVGPAITIHEKSEDVHGWIVAVNNCAEMDAGSRIVFLAQQPPRYGGRRGIMPLETYRRDQSERIGREEQFFSGTLDSGILQGSSIKLLLVEGSDKVKVIQSLPRGFIGDSVLFGSSAPLLP